MCGDIELLSVCDAVIIIRENIDINIFCKEIEVKRKKQKKMMMMGERVCAIKLSRAQEKKGMYELWRVIAHISHLLIYHIYSID